MTITRYEMYVEASKESSGSWVAYDDHEEELKARDSRIEELEVELDTAHNNIDELQDHVSNQDKELEELREENHRLRVALQEIIDS